MFEFLSTISSWLCGPGIRARDGEDSPPQAPRIQQSQSLPDVSDSKNQTPASIDGYHRSETTESINSGQIVDYHGYTAQQAVLDLNVRLRENDERGQDTTVITGQGHHSKNGRPVVKEAVMKELNRGGRRYEFKKNNPGALVVKAKRG